MNSIKQPTKFAHTCNSTQNKINFNIINNNYDFNQ